MEHQTVVSNHRPGTLQSILPTVGPAILVSIGYVDPGKWVAIIDGGARFGIDLLVPMLIFNVGAILCQYLAAKIGVVTGKDLAQICGDEYDRSTCMFLGVQTLISVIALDLTTIVGIALALHHFLGADLCTCVFLTAVDAVLFPLFAALMEKYKAKLLHISIGSFILLFYILGAFSSQPEAPLPSGMLSKLSGGSAFALMSLLGASVMPHYFYLHSAIVMQQSEPQNVSKGSLSHGHFLSISCIFSGIYLVNYVLLNSAANVFDSTVLVGLTFPDAMSLMEQVLRSPVAIFLLLVILYLVNLLSGWTWNIGGQEVLHGFLRLDIPTWLQHITIRTFAIAPALYCVWTSGVEGIYQLLIYTQVIIALLLPASVIPLFRIASSRAIMGAYKISPLLEFLSLITFLGMLGLKGIFVVDMIFGESDWVVNLRWNMFGSSSLLYIILLCTACTSFCLMLWLAATPLKSATQIDPQVWGWDVQNAIQEPTLQREETYVEESRYEEEEPIEKQEQLPLPGKPVEHFADKRIENIDHDLPEEIIDQEIHSSTTEESHFGVTFPTPQACHIEEAGPAIESLSVPVSDEVNKVTNGHLLDANTVETESIDPVEKTVAMVRDLLNEKEDDEGEDSMPSLSDGPASLRSLSGKSEDGGNGTGSLSRLAGLGRAARRQLASALDEFWGQFFDFHGQLTQEAKEKKLDVLLLIDLKPTSQKVDTGVTELSGYFPSVGVRTSDSFGTPSLCDSPKQLRVTSNIESHGVQSGSSPLWSNRVQLLDAYVQGSSRNLVDSGERRYYSLRALPSSDTYEDQPATVHGYQISSISNRISRERGSNLNAQMETPMSSSAAVAPKAFRDPVAVALAQQLQNGKQSPLASGLQSAAISRNSSMQGDRSYLDAGPPGFTDKSGVSSNSKKYHSSPDISGLAGPYRDRYVPENSAQWGNSVGFGSPFSNYEPPGYSNTAMGYGNYSNSGPGTGARYSSLVSGAGSLGYTERSIGYVKPLSFSGSLWSKQPYEQFGHAAKSSTSKASGLGSRSNTIAREATSLLDSEAQLLRSFRCCIVKLLKLEGSDWLFRHGDGADEELIDRVAARERLLYEAEARELNQAHPNQPQYAYPDWRFDSTLKNDEAGLESIMVSSVPHCGEGCVWKSDLLISFGVWCIHRILYLSLMESRPELWGKYTYVLNRLQGVIDPAFTKPRSAASPCFCLHVPVTSPYRSSPPSGNGSLPPTAKPARGKCTNAATLLDLIKEVETAVSCRKGRSGTAAGDVAFPKGKENLVSVLKRYKRRLSNKPVGK